MTGGEAVVESLIANGIDTEFGQGRSDLIGKGYGVLFANKFGACRDHFYN